VEQVERNASVAGAVAVEPAPVVPEPESSGKVKEATTVVVVEPTRRLALGLGDLWTYRELLYFLFWRDVKVRYKQTVLGGAWAILQPVATMIVFTVFLGRLAKISSDGVPYSLFAYSGLLPWGLFASSLTESSASLVNSKQLITKVFFPRLIIPVASVLAGLVDFAVASSILVVLMLYHHVVPTIGILVVPLLVAFTVVTALSVGFFLSALNVQYRDVRYTIPFLVQAWMFATPIVYPSSLVPEKWRFLYGLNPMAGVVEGFRWALFGTRGASGLILVSVVSVVALFLLGVVYFRKTERQFADLV
jgi:lipopolysaccharide transport system permease protein